MQRRDEDEKKPGFGQENSGSCEKRSDRGEKNARDKGENESKPKVTQN
jgi:hypothetical protein